MTSRTSAPHAAASVRPSPVACAVWSRHAADLAEPIAQSIEHWDETPSTQAMVHDGLLERLLPGIFIPPDLLWSAVGRALALGCAIGARLRPHHVISGASAAWVATGGVPPVPASLLSTAHRGDVAGVVLSNSHIEHSDVETIGGCPVTEPGRTAVDLLRFARDSNDLEWVARLISEGHVDVRRISALLKQLDRYPGARTGEVQLQRVSAMLREFHPGPLRTGRPIIRSRSTVSKS